MDPLAAGPWRQASQQQGSGNSAAAVISQHWWWWGQGGGGIQLGSPAAALRHWGLAATAVTTAVLPPRAAGNEDIGSNSNGGAQTINNQLKAAMVTAMETATMTATTMTMETKRTAAAAEGRQQRSSQY